MSVTHVMLDMRDSRSHHPDDLDGYVRRVKTMMARIHDDPEIRLETRLGWVRGDELHGQALDVASVARIAQLVVEDGGWYLSIGIGSQYRWGSRGNGVTGSAFRRADRAMRRAKRHDPPIALESSHEAAPELERLVRSVAVGELDALTELGERFAGLDTPEPIPAVDE